MTDFDLEARFGPARRRGEEFLPRHFDIAQSLQKVIEETVLSWPIGCTERRDWRISAWLAASL